MEVVWCDRRTKQPICRRSIFKFEVSIICWASQCCAQRIQVKAWVRVEANRSVGPWLKYIPVAITRSSLYRNALLTLSGLFQYCSWSWRNDGTCSMRVTDSKVLIYNSTRTSQVSREGTNPDASIAWEGQWSQSNGRRVWSRNASSSRYLSHMDRRIPFSRKHSSRSHRKNLSQTSRLHTRPSWSVGSPSVWKLLGHLELLQGIAAVAVVGGVRDVGHDSSSLVLLLGAIVIQSGRRAWPDNSASSNAASDPAGNSLNMPVCDCSVGNIEAWDSGSACCLGSRWL